MNSQGPVDNALNFGDRGFTGDRITEGDQRVDHGFGVGFSDAGSGEIVLLSILYRRYVAKGSDQRLPAHHENGPFRDDQAFNVLARRSEAHA